MKWILIGLLTFFASIQTSVSYGATKRVTLVGDSQSFFGLASALQHELRQDCDLSAYGISGATFATFLQNPICGAGSNCPYRLGYLFGNPRLMRSNSLPPDFPGLDQILKNERPDILIIQLGTNEILQSPNRDSLSQRPSVAIKRFLALIPNQVTCYWVGPADIRGPMSTKQLQNFIHQFQDLAKDSHCQYIDSTTLQNAAGKALSPSLDGVHFTTPGYTDWAQALRPLIKFN